MGNFTQNGISFQLNADNITPFTSKYTNTQNYNTSTKLYNNGSAKLFNVGVTPSINGIEIDWNSAVLPNGDISTGGQKIINTTGELIQIINNIQKEIYILTDIIFSYI